MYPMQCARLLEDDGWQIYLPAVYLSRYPATSFNVFWYSSLPHVVMRKQVWRKIEEGFQVVL